MPKKHPVTGLRIAEIGEQYGAAPIVEWSPRPGYLTAREVFCHVLYLKWGRRADGDYDWATDHICVPVSDRLRNLEFGVHWAEATRMIRAAALNGQIEMLAEKDGSLRRFVRDRWQLQDDNYWEDTLFLATFQLPAPNAFEDLRDSYLCFEAQPTTEWLKTITSDYVLPDPLKRDPEHLADTPCHLHKAASWLAGQDPAGIYELSQQRADLRELVAKIQTEDEKSPKHDLEDAVALADGLARLAVLEDACHALMAEVQAGNLCVMGRRNEKAPVCELNPKDLQAAIRFQPMLDAVLPKARSEGIEFDQAQRECLWKDIKFYRRQLLETWGADRLVGTRRKPHDISTESHPESPRGRRPMYDWDGLYRHLDERWEYHGPLDQSDPVWSRQADVEKAAQDWFISKTGDHPSESTIRARVSKWLKKTTGGR